MRWRNGERWHCAEEKARLAECRAYDQELNGVYGKLLAAVYFRLDKAMKAFWKRLTAGERPAGFPRVRPRQHFFTLCSPAMYIKIEGKAVLLPPGGKSEKTKRFQTMRAGLPEDVPAGYKQVAISRDARGHSYASCVYAMQEEDQQPGQFVAFDLGIKTRASGVNEQGRFYHIGGFKGQQGYNKQRDKIRSKGDRCKKKSRRYSHLSQVYQRVSAKKRTKQKDGLHTASQLIAHHLAERAVVSGDLSQRQLVTKEHEAHLKAKHRAVFNDWGLVRFVCSKLA